MGTCQNIATKQPEKLLHMHMPTTWPRALLIHKRKICSSFCAFSGLTIHTGKIKATIVGKINSKHELKTKPDGTKYCFSTLTIFDYQWKPTECPIDPTLATYKNLGVYHDLRRKSNDVDLDLRCTNNDAFEGEKQKQQPCCLIS
jgi:hypothetical protein